MIEKKETNEANVQNNYKDTIFRMLFKEKENLLALYNALNQTAYTDVGSLEITTLENAVYMNYKNDVSFVFDLGLMLYEHQSTVNPNMPLRDLFYVSRVLQGRTRDNDLYGSTLIKIPAPRFVVFYNGTEEQPEQQVLKLSEAKGIRAVCGSGHDICKENGFSESSRMRCGLLHREWNTCRFFIKESCGGDSSVYI